MHRSLFVVFQLFTALSLCLFHASLSHAQEADKQNTGRQKIGLVLSGGGARGAAHVGVLKILEENHIPIDMIAGTSFGAIIGGLYASGYSANELEGLLADIDWQETLTSQIPRNKRSFRRKLDDNGFLIKFNIGVKGGELKLPSGLITPYNLRLTMRDLIKNVATVHNFDNLSIPFRAVATDIETGEAVVLGSGNLDTAMIASMAVPALFPPVLLDDKLLVDGGVANNVPIDVARSMGADIVIVVDISTPLMKKDDITSFTSVINQLTMLMTNQTSKAQIATLTDKDILITPELGDIGLVDFDRILEAVPKGIASAQKALPQLKALSLPQDAWYKHQNANNLKDQIEPVIDFINITNKSKTSDKIILARLSQKLGQAFDPAQLSDDLATLYGLELFEELSYSTVTENGQTGIEINATDSEIGEDFLRFGIALQDDFEGKSSYQLGISYTNLNMNSRGGEWKTLVALGAQTGIATEFYQPIDYAERFYLFTKAQVHQVNRNIIDNQGILLSQVRISAIAMQLGGGFNLGEWGTFRTGFQREFGKVRGRIGFPDSNSFKFDQTTFIASFSVDTLDNIEFPHSGISIDAIYRNNLTWLNGDGRVDAIQIGAFLPFSWGRNTLGFNANFGTSFNGTPDETDLFPLGGFMRLTAFTPGQITGNHGGTVAAIYYRRVAGGLRYLTNTPIYAGGSLEAGNVWNDRNDMSFGDLRWSSSLFLGADTLIGPVYLGGAIGTGGQTSAFLFVGQLF